MTDAPLTSSFYDDAVFCQRESDLMYAILCHSANLQQEARRHIKRGYNYRLGMIESSRLFLRENTQPGRSVPDTYLLTEIQIHLNAYYLNVRGALDNLAWALQHQFSLFPDVEESSGKGQSKIHLFSSKFRRAVKGCDMCLKEVLDSNDDWSRSLSRWRDPAAHRIPLYVPPSVLTTEEQKVEFRRLDELAGTDEKSRQGRRRIEVLEEARRLGTFRPWFITEDIAGELECHSLPDQVADDHLHFLGVSEAVVLSLGINLPMRGTRHLNFETGPR